MHMFCRGLAVFWAATEPPEKPHSIPSRPCRLLLLVSDFLQDLVAGLLSWLAAVVLLLIKLWLQARGPHAMFFPAAGAAAES